MQEVIKSTSFDTLLTILTGLKNLDIQYSYAGEDDGSITCWIEEPHLIDNAPTLNEALEKLVTALRERAYDYMREFDLWVKGCPAELPYILKILFSTDEELRQCLHGKS